MPQHKPTDLIRSGGRLRRRASADAAVPARSHKSALGLIRAGGRFFAMIAVTFVFAASVVSIIPTAQASESSDAQQWSGTAAAQSLEAVSPSVVAAAVTRDGFGITLKPKPPPPPPPPPTAITRYAALALVPSTSTSTLQWPVPAGTRMSYGFGPRSCGGCSSFHQGVDLNAPSGSTVWAIADGVVVSSSASGGGLGTFVTVRHNIDGQSITSVYAHMQSGSVPVAAGQTVTVGQPLGAVGCTGSCTGTHLHFEIHLDGTPIDPVAWFASKNG